MVFLYSAKTKLSPEFDSPYSLYYDTSLYDVLIVIGDRSKVFFKVSYLIRVWRTWQQVMNSRQSVIN